MKLEKKNVNVIYLDLHDEYHNSYNKGSEINKKIRSKDIVQKRVRFIRQMLILFSLTTIVFSSIMLGTIVSKLSKMVDNSESINIISEVLDSKRILSSFTDAVILYENYDNDINKLKIKDEFLMKLEKNKKLIEDKQIKNMIEIEKLKLEESVDVSNEKQIEKINKIDSYLTKELNEIKYIQDKVLKEGMIGLSIQDFKNLNLYVE